MQLRPEVLGEAAPTKRGATFALEIQRGGIEEGDRQLAEQRLAMAVERFLDELGHRAVVLDCLAEPGHGLVGLLQG